jgi:cephalosporin-C deacetylase
MVVLSALTACRNAPVVEKPVARAAKLQPIDISTGWKMQYGDDPSWSEPGFDDSAWPEAKVNVAWDDKYDGWGWYRLHVVIPEELKNDANIQKRQKLTLKIGCIDDKDFTFFNGKSIGTTNGWQDKRKYDIPLDLVKWGEDNVLAVRVQDDQGGGGMYQGTYSIGPATWDVMTKIELEADKADGISSVGEPLGFSVRVANGYNEPLAGTVKAQVETDDYKPVVDLEGKYQVAANGTASVPFQFESSAPGFFHVNVTVMRDGSAENLTDIIGLACAPDKFDRPTNQPKDMKEFWDKAKADLEKVDPQYKVTLDPDRSRTNVDVYLVEMRSLGDVRVRGWYEVPKKPGKYAAVLCVPGYSSEQTPSNSYDDMIVFSLNIRGHGNSKDDFDPGFDYPGMLESGLESKDTYAYRGAYMDCVRAVDFLASRPEVDPKRIAVMGDSQGGALSFATAALDHRIAFCVPSVPFLSDFKRYFTVAYWPNNEFKQWVESDPSRSWDRLYGTLAYFDIMNLAPWIQCPVFMGSGLIDTTCPSAINFAAFNHVTTPKEYRTYPKAGHWLPGEHWGARAEWLRKNLGVIE